MKVWEDGSQIQDRNAYAHQIKAGVLNGEPVQISQTTFNDGFVSETRVVEDRVKIDSDNFDNLTLPLGCVGVGKVDNHINVDLLDQHVVYL